MGERDAEVRHDGLAVLKQHVVGFDIAVDDPVAVGVAEPRGDFGGDTERVGDGELRLPREPGAKRLPLDVRHDVEHRTLDAAGIEQRENVGMLQFGGRLDLPQEPVDADAHRQLEMHDFDGDLAIVAHIVGEIDVGHAAGADLPLHGVAVRHGQLQLIERFHNRGAYAAETFTSTHVGLRPTPRLGRLRGPEAPRRFLAGAPCAPPLCSEDRILARSRITV